MYLIEVGSLKPDINVDSEFYLINIKYDVINSAYTIG